MFFSDYIFSNCIRLSSLLCLAFGLAFPSMADDVISGKFNLIDHHGNPVSESSYPGKLKLVFFGFTNCPVVCPTTMADVARVERLLGERSHQLQVLFITIDPEYDTVSRLATYVAAFNPSIVGLTGSTQQIKQAAKGFNATYGRTPVSGMTGESEIFHSTYLYLMDSEGKLVDLIGYGTRPAVIVEKISQYLQG